MVRFESTDEQTSNQTIGLASVTYLPGVSPGMERRSPLEKSDDDCEAETAAGVERERAEKLLLQRLRGRSLSVAEAISVLKGTELSESDIADVIERFTELLYIDEEKLADQIIRSHHERKGLGRTGVAAEMRRRRLAPSVILDKLEEIPDDEQERATELACKRIQQLERFDDQTIDRRLTGFLMRKGYASQAVRVAVKAALASRSGGSSVRFR